MQLLDKALAMLKLSETLELVQRRAVIEQKWSTCVLWGNWATLPVEGSTSSSLSYKQTPNKKSDSLAELQLHSDTNRRN